MTLGNFMNRAPAPVAPYDSKDKNKATVHNAQTDRASYLTSNNNLRCDS